MTDAKTIRSEYEKEHKEKFIRNQAAKWAFQFGDFSKDYYYYMTCPLEEIWIGDINEENDDKETVRE